MTIEVAEKLNNLFTADFLEKNSDVASIDKLYEEVTKVDTTITKADFEEYIEAISYKMHQSNELSEEALDEVAGGGPITWMTMVTIAGGIVSVTNIVSFCYKSGKAVGEAIYNWQHR